MEALKIALQAITSQRLLTNPEFKAKTSLFEAVRKNGIAMLLEAIVQGADIDSTD